MLVLAACGAGPDGDDESADQVGSAEGGQAVEQEQGAPSGEVSEQAESADTDSVAGDFEGVSQQVIALSSPRSGDDMTYDGGYAVELVGSTVLVSELTTASARRLDGGVLWSTPLPFEPTWSYTNGTSWYLSGGFDGRVVAIHVESGEVRWVSQLPETDGTFSGRVAASADDRFVFAAGLLNRGFVLSGSDGQVLSEVELGQDHGGAFAGFIGDQLIVAGGMDASGVASTVRSVLPESGEVRWEVAFRSALREPLAVADGVIAVRGFDGAVALLNESDGSLMCDTNAVFDADPWAFAVHENALLVQTGTAMVEMRPRCEIDGFAADLVGPTSGAEGFVSSGLGLAGVQTSDSAAEDRLVVVDDLGRPLLTSEPWRAITDIAGSESAVAAVARTVDEKYSLIIAS